MNTIDLYAFWVVGCGLVFNAWLALKCGRVLGRALYAGAAATSFTRFCWACGRTHGFRVRRLPTWAYAAQIWFEFFITELGVPRNTTSCMGGAGVWRGIGNWTVFPVTEDKPCAQQK